MTVGQQITPEICETALFLRSKGIMTTCLEFNFFKTASGEILLSSDIVASKETPGRQACGE
jgi:hypothetical protein